MPTLEGLDLVFRALCALFIVLLCVPMAAHAAGSGWAPGRAAPVVLALTVAILVPLRLPAWLPLALMVVALTISIPEASAPVALAPRLLLGIIGFLLVVEFHARRATTLMLGTATLYVLYSAMVGSREFALAAFDDAVLTTVLTATGAAFLAVLVRNLKELERSGSERLAAELSAAFQGSGEAVAAATRRRLHDEVIGTLSAVADRAHRPGLGALDNALRADCARVAAMLSDDHTGSRPPPGPLHELVARLARRSTVAVVIDGGPEVNLTGDAADSVARAVAESLRNVARHAPWSCATIRWWGRGGDVVLEILDESPGMEPEGRPADQVGSGVRLSTPGFGIRGSIGEPMAAIGGTAEVGWRQGGGFAVTLAWPETDNPQAPRESSLDRVHRESRQAIAGQQRLVMRVAVPVLAANIWLALRYTWGDPSWAAEGALAGLIVAASLVVGWRLAQGPLPPFALVLLSLTLAMTAHTHIELSGGPSTLSDYNSYIVGLSSLVLTIAAFYLPPEWTVALVAPLLAVVIMHAIEGDLSLAQSGGAINAALAPPFLGYLFGAYLRWSRRRQEEEESRLRFLASEAHRQQLHEALSGRQLSRARRMVGPWLSDVAVGRHDLDDPATGQRARALAGSMRDDLNAPGVLDDALTRRIERARESGIVVVVHALDGEAGECGPVLRLLDRALDLGSALERIQVRLPQARGSAAELSLLPRQTPATMELLLRGLDGYPTGFDTTTSQRRW